MVRLFFWVTVTSIIVTSVGFSDGFTVHNSLLRGHVFKTFVSIDWFQCILECYTQELCLSYNYFPAGKICELNSFGSDDPCKVNVDFISATGWIHHSLDTSQVKL